MIIQYMIHYMDINQYGMLQQDSLLIYIHIHTIIITQVFIIIMLIHLIGVNGEDGGDGR